MAGKSVLNDLDLGGDLDGWIATQRLQIESRLRIAVQNLSSDLRARGQSEANEVLGRAWEDWQGISRLPADCRIAVLPFEQVHEDGGDLFLADGIVDELLSRLGELKEISLPGRMSVRNAVDDNLTIPELTAKLNVTHIIEGTVHTAKEEIRLTIRLIDGAKDKQIWSD